MTIGPDFWWLVAIAVAIITISTSVSAWRARRHTPASRRQRFNRAVARAQARLDALNDRCGGPRHA